MIIRPIEREREREMTCVYQFEYPFPSCFYKFTFLQNDAFPSCGFTWHSGRHALRQRLEEVWNDFVFLQSAVRNILPSTCTCCYILTFLLPALHIAWLWAWWWATWEHILAFQSCCWAKEGEFKWVMFSVYSPWVIYLSANCINYIALRYSFLSYPLACIFIYFALQFCWLVICFGSWNWMRWEPT